MKIAQFENERGKLVGLWLKTHWIDFSSALKMFAEIVERNECEAVPTIDNLLTSGMFGLNRFKRVSEFILSHRMDRYLALSNDSTLKAPLSRPGKVIALGRNYALHAKESGRPVPKEPIIFEKASSAIIGPGEAIRVPKHLGRIDHEVELAVVIGRRARRVRKRDAYRYVAGYCIALDITARDLQEMDLAAANPWFRSKSFDTFMPLGPWLLLSDEITPPVDLSIECSVNGKLRQRANTRDLVFDIPTMIRFITEHITLEPGDIISTGTPEGIGPIRPGDVITSRIEKIGEMKNPVKLDR